MSACPYTPSCAERCFPCTGECRYVIERPFPSDPTDPEAIKARAEACGFCQGEPVGNAAVWAGCLDEEPLPCPRCGVTTRRAAA